MAPEVGTRSLVPIVEARHLGDGQRERFRLVKETYGRLSMWKFLKTRGVDLAIAAIALTALMTEPAWARAVPVLDFLRTLLTG